MLKEVSMLIVGGIISCFFTELTKSTKRITIVERSRFYLYNEPERNVPNLEIHYNKKLIQKKFLLLEVSLVNSGNSDIEIEDGDLSLVLPKGSNWESIEVIGEYKDICRFQFEKVGNYSEEYNHQANLEMISNKKNKGILKEKGCINFKAFISYENNSKYFHMKNRIMDLKSTDNIFLNNYPLGKKDRKKIYNKNITNLIGSLVGLIVTSIGLIDYIFYNIENNKLLLLKNIGIYASLMILYLTIFKLLLNSISNFSKDIFAEKMFNIIVGNESYNDNEL